MTMSRSEEWRDVKGYEGLYQVSDMGRVKSLNYNHTGKEKILKNRLNRYGYYEVVLCKDNTMKSFKVHRLVTQAFISNPDNFPQVNHINEDKTDNRLTNLEWCDAKYNINYGTHTEKISKPVAQLDFDLNTVKIYPSATEVERQTGFKQSYISSCCKGKFKKAYGYIWIYV